MGAAASVNQVYTDAAQWFKLYFDAESYVEDFNEIDKDHDGGVEYEDLYRWLQEKAARTDSAWKSVLTSRHIFDKAHKYALLASKVQFRAASSSEVVVDKPAADGTEKEEEEEEEEEEDELDDDLCKVIDVDGFRVFLVHLFAFCLLWVHFKSADEWSEGDDVGNESLNLDEFRLACRTLSTAQSNESASIEQIDADFKLLDKNNDESIDFLEVCEYVCKFIDPNFAERTMRSKATAASLLQARRQSVATAGWMADEAASSRSLLQHQQSPSSSAKASATADSAATISTTTAAGSASAVGSGGVGRPVGDRKLDALAVVAKEMDKIKAISQFEQIKMSTEKSLGVL